MALLIAMALAIKLIVKLLFSSNLHMQIIAMGFVGRLSKSGLENQYTFVLVDHFTRWPVAYAVEDTEAEIAARLFRDSVHFYGSPEELISDRSSQFTSELIRALRKQ